MTSVSSPPSPKSAGLYRAGTLTYTRMGLAALFFWLLWGYFVYNLMEFIIPSILPLLLKEHEATNSQISFITTSLNVIGSMIFNPIIGFASDRYRSRYGRRRPFILWTTPMVVVCLAMIPFGPDMAHWLQDAPAWRWLMGFSPVMPAILFIGLFVAGFQIFDVFIGSVYFYLVRDTVPEEMIGRVFAGYRLVMAPTNLLYQWYIFPHAGTHMRAIFVGIAIFYGVSIYLMCWRVKEGQYPPPAPLPGRHFSVWSRAVDAVRLYIRDCFRDPVYWTSFAAVAMGTTWANASGPFVNLFYKYELELSYQTIGNIVGYTSMVGLVCAMPFGYVADKLNAFRLMQVCLAAKAVLAAAAWYYVRDARTLLIFSLLLAAPASAFAIAVSKIQILIYPREKYGQFASANAAFASMGAIGVAVVAGKFIDWVGNYRAYLLWAALLSIVASVFFLWVEERWRKLGGNNEYQAP